jgi:uncharacterized protein
MAGRHVILEPLDRCHAEALFHALDDAEVHRYIPRPRPRGVEDMAAVVAGMLAEAAGVNTEAKLLMTRAFEVLGAQRVEWQTDILNLRSQAAIERLGATREGVLRRHRRRADGTWRDSVYYGMTAAEWPVAKNTLVARLARG